MDGDPLKDRSPRVAAPGESVPAQRRHNPALLVFSFLKRRIAALFQARANDSRPVYALVIFLALIPIAFAGVYGYRSTDREMTQAVLAKRESISNLVAAVLTEKLDRVIDVGVSLSTRVRFRQLVEARQWDEAIDIMSAVPSQLPYVERLFLADPKGVVVADTPPLPNVRGRDFSHRDWYQGAVRTGKPYVSPIYKRAAVPQVNVVAVAVPIQNPAQALLGILVLQIKLEVFWEWFKDAPMDPHWLIYIVDGNGQTAFHPNYTAKGDTANFSAVPAVQRALKGGRGVDIEFNKIEREQRVTAYTPVPRYGWAVVLDEPAHTAFASRNAQLQRFSIIYALMLALGGLAAYLVMRAWKEARHKADLQLLVAERTAELENVNKELEAFSYSVSHDLRAPLRSIDGFSRIVLDDCKDKLDAQYADYLQRVRAATQRMGELIDDLLKLSRVSRAGMNRTSVDLSALALEVAEDLRNAHPERRLTIDIQPGLTAVGDPSLLRIMLENLLGNAWKFTGKTEDARIEVRARNGEADERVYFIRDNGAGFDMNYANKLFGAFQRLHGAQEFPGTGIGLATVQRIVRRHGGRVWAEGAVNRGATFYFAL